MSWSSQDSASTDEEWDILSASSVDGEVVSVSDATEDSFVFFTSPSWASRSSASVPSRLNYISKSLPSSNGDTPTKAADYSIPGQSECTCDFGCTTPASLSNVVLTAQSTYQEGSGCATPDDLSEISSTSSSEGDPDVRPAKTLPLPRSIDAALKTTKPVPINEIYCANRDPTVIMRAISEARVSYLHWYAFFCDFWPAVMQKFEADCSVLPTCLVEQYRRFFPLPAEMSRGAHTAMYHLLTSSLSKILDSDPLNKYLYDLLCYAYRAAYARYLFD